MPEPKRTLRHDALTILKSALKAADPAEAVHRHVRLLDGVLIAGRRRYPLRDFRNIYVIGAGKASASMAAAIEKTLGGHIATGLINVKDGHLSEVKRIRLHECGHPVPDERGVAGAQEIAGIVAGAKAEDLVICLISGGASALLPFPAQPISLGSKQATTRLLLHCGANIGEVNVVRKHISSIKGGHLAALAYPARVLSLLLSDVIGDDLHVIGSGLTAPDPTTFQEAWSILERYDLTTRVPVEVAERIQEGIAGTIPETPKPGAAAFSRTQNLVIGSNKLALDAASAQARALGYKTMVLSSFIEGEAREVATVHAAILKEVLASGRPVRRPACIISGGETTVTVRGEGVGGRNQEFVLKAAMETAGLPNTVVLSAGTDGSDGPTDAAGALCDGETIARAQELNLDPQAHLSRNDSYRFFDSLGDLIRTGPTNTNVMDVRILLVGPKLPSANT